MTIWRSWPIAVLLLFLFASFALGQTTKPSREDDLKAAAKAVVDALVKEDFAAASKDFDPAVKKALPVEKLEELWKALSKQVGPFKKQTGIRTEPAGRNDTVWAACQFEKLNLDIQITFNPANKIVGFSIVPAGSRDYKPPAYVKREAFRETDVTVGSGDWALPGVLTLPVGDGPFPAVVLVHGSGPNDRDQTLGGNKPFRDLAWGLATQGVAVLRYDKRTRTHSVKLATLKEPFTVKEEVLDDALAAVALLRQTKGVKGQKVFLLGHSLGAMMAPAIGKQAPELAGLIILAGPTRPLEDLLVEQFDYLYSLEQNPSEKQKADLEKVKKQVERLKDPKLTADTPATELPLNVPASYWLSLRGYQPAEVASKLKQPLLILQGERDYQVTMKDFAGWETAFKGRKNATLKSYPKLNHLFMEGEGKSKPAEYNTAGHVAREVLDDIVAWVKKQ